MNSPFRKEMELSNGWHEAIVSGTIAAAWVFSLIGGFLSGTKTYANCSFTPTRLLRNLAFLIDRLGRKPVILAASVVFAVGSVVMGAADGKEALLVGRIVVGIGIGMWAVKCFSAFQQWTKAQQSIDPPTACACVCVYPVATRVVVPRRMRQLIILRVSSTLSFLPPMSPGTRVNIIVMKKMRLADSATA